MSLEVTYVQVSKIDISSPLQVHNGVVFLPCSNTVRSESIPRILDFEFHLETNNAALLREVMLTLTLQTIFLALFS